MVCTFGLGDFSKQDHNEQKPSDLSNFALFQFLISFPISSLFSSATSCKFEGFWLPLARPQLTCMWKYSCTMKLFVCVPTFKFSFWNIYEGQKPLKLTAAPFVPVGHV